MTTYACDPNMPHDMRYDAYDVRNHPPNCPYLTARIEELEAALLSVAVNPPTSLSSQLKEDNRGLVRAIFALLGFIGGFQMAAWFYTNVGEWVLMCRIRMSVQTARIIAFVLIVIVVAIVVDQAGRLLQRLLNDLGQQADQLPCLQHGLMRTWKVWSERGGAEALDLEDYQQVGRMSQAEADVRLEQAVYGLDARDELTLHALLAEGLSRHYEVAREVHYPSSWGKKLTHRMRCDLVLTPKGRPLRLDSAAPTLFDPANLAPPDEALWLEVKVAYQFREGGARHGGYGAQWRTAVVEDLRKMDAEPRIREAGLVLVVFNESPEILAKDLELFEIVLMQKEVLAGFRHVRSVEILRDGKMYQLTVEAAESGTVSGI